MAYDKNADLLVTGQPTQTASGQNIILATGGTGSFDKLLYRSVAIQIIPTGTVSSGVVTFEGSNDGTTFVAVPLYDEASLTTNPVSTVSPATGVNRYFLGPVYWRYFRARISTVIGGGGSIAAVTLFSPIAYSPDIFTVTQATAANLNATVSGTVTANLGTGGTAATSIGKAEDAVHASGDTGVFVLGVRRDTVATGSSATGDYEGLQMDALGRVYVNNQTVTTFNPGFVIFKTTALTNVAQQVKTGTGNIFGYNFINVNTVPIYVKIFGVPSASVTVGTTVADRVLLIPAADATNPGSIVLANDETSFFNGGTGISVFASSVLSSTGTQTAPTTAIYAEVIYV